MKNQMEITGLTERLNEVYKYLFANHGVSSQKQFAEILQVQRTALSAAMNGNSMYLTKNLFMKICAAFPGVFNLDYLLTGIGELTLREKKIDVTSNQNSRNVNPKNDLDMSSVINSIIAAKDETIASLRNQVERSDDMIKSLRAQITRLETLIDQKDELIALLSQPKNEPPIVSYHPLGVSEDKSRIKRP